MSTAIYDDITLTDIDRGRRDDNNCMHWTTHWRGIDIETGEAKTWEIQYRTGPGLEGLWVQGHQPGSYTVNTDGSTSPVTAWKQVLGTCQFHGTRHELREYLLPTDQREREAALS